MTNENPNKRGTLGEIAVCKELLQLGYEVFVEVGNHSKVDLVVLDENYKTYKIQIKTIKSRMKLLKFIQLKIVLTRNIIRDI